MINEILFRQNGKTLSKPVSQLKGLLSQKKIVWIDVLHPSKEDLDFLHNNLMLHELALDYCIARNPRPRVDVYPGHMFIGMKDISYADEKLSMKALHFFLGENVLVTVHKKPINAIADFKKRLFEEPKLFQKGADFLLYQIMLRVVESYFPVLDAMDETIDSIENRIFRKPDQSVLTKTFKLRRAVLSLRKTISPQREIVNSIIRGEFPFIKNETMLYYRDLYDHLIRMYDLIDTYRDLITGMLDAYLSVVSNKMNEVIKVLTILATIMMPLTLITGIYGMNFKFMPEIHSPWGQANGYFLALGLMLAVSLIMIFFFKRKKWI